MKRIALAVSVVLLMGVQAWAIDCGTGGTIYWNDVIGNISKFRLWRLPYDTSFTKIGNPVNFDNVTHANTYGSWSSYMKMRNVEVFDPRTLGGTGKLAVSAVTNNTPPSSGYTGANYLQAWDVVRVDPIGLGHTLLSDGRLPVGGWNSQYSGPTLTAPQNWVPGTTSNAISLVTIQGIWGSTVNALYDTNNSGLVDNTTSEGTQFYKYGGNVSDAEFGGDKALYRSAFAGVYGQMVPQISRIYPKTAAGAYGDQMYLDVTKPAWRTGGMIGTQSDGVGIAASRVLPNTTAPNVYLVAMTNDNFTQQSPHLALFAMRDTNGDNTITPGTDIVTEIWEQGQKGISAYSDSMYGGEDVELITDPQTGKMTLFFNDYAGGIYAFTLADNGLSIVGTGKVIHASGGPDGYTAGFEIDMTPPAAIPEPTTLLLLCSGALGGLGYIRRQRMK